MPAKCPKGEIRRVGYKRGAYTRADGTPVKGTYVKSGCVPDKGKPGKTPARKKVLPKPTKGALSQYGYFDVKQTSVAKRHAALLKAVKATDYATIVRRVNLVSNYNKNSDPRTHKIMRSDIAWMQKVLAPKYSKTAARRRVSRKKASRKAMKKVSRKGSKKLVKAGTKTVGGRSRQLYHISGSDRKFYRYKKTDGSFGRRYV